MRVFLAEIAPDLLGVLGQTVRCLSRSILALLAQGLPDGAKVSALLLDLLARLRRALVNLLADSVLYLPGRLLSSLVSLAGCLLGLLLGRCGDVRGLRLALLCTATALGAGRRLLVCLRHERCSPLDGLGFAGRTVQKKVRPTRLSAGRER